MEQPTPSASVTRILAECCTNGSDAVDEVFPLVYGELRRLAEHHMRQERAGHTLQATAVVGEAYLRLADLSNPQWKSRAHFYAAASRIIRNILVDHARARKAQKRGGGRALLTLGAASGVSQDTNIDVVALHEALEKLAAMDSRLSRIVELRFFGGLTVEEVADLLSISTTTVKSEWQIAKGWLREELSSS